MTAFRSLQYSLEGRGVSVELLAATMETVEPVPEELYAYAIDAPPPAEIQYEMAAIFPDWVRAMEQKTPLMEEGPTRVDTQGGVDIDSIDVAKLIRDLDLQGYSQVLEAEVDDIVFGIPIIKMVTQVVRLAAMYELYLDMRLQGVPQEPAPRKFWKMPGPEWLLLGLELGTVAAQSATDVLRMRASRKRMSIGELAELIRKNERA